MFERLLRILSCGALALFALGCIGFAEAQEVKKEWAVVASSSQKFATERLAQEHIESNLSTYQENGAFEWAVRSTTVLPDKVIYDYSLKPAKLVKTDWEYEYDGQYYDSEEALFSAMKAGATQDPPCPATEFPVTQPWTGIPGGGTGDDGSDLDEDILIGVVNFYFDPSTSQCHSRNDGNLYAQRSRQAHCPNPIVMEWQDDMGMCVMSHFFESSGNQYFSSVLPKQCDAAGNPCDPTTGDKLQPEPDFDLGWIRFDRTYHSLTSTAGGALGVGWTHSHNLRLSLGVDSTSSTPGTELKVGLIGTDGTQTAFEKIGGYYEANDGSGDRLVQQETGWQLSRAQERILFSASGLMQRRDFEDGTSLAYAYDSRGRLLSITHSTGRRLDFQYLASGDDSLISAVLVGGQALAAYAYMQTGELASVTYADGGVRTYHYEDTRFPGFLTGVTAEDNRRYSWFGYDAAGRVICSRHSGDCAQTDVGVDGVRLEYTQTGTTIVTDALGKQSTYALTDSGASGLPRKVNDIAESNGSISRTYLPEGTDFRRRLQSVTDRRGIVTNYAYAEADDPIAGAISITSTTEATGTAGQHVTERHVAVESNRLVQRTVGNRETRIARNARLQPSSITVGDNATGDTRVTTLTYCEAVGQDCPQVGLLRSVDGPRSDVADAITYAWYTADDAGCATGGICAFRKGDLHSIANASGQVTEYLAYDGAGRVLSVKDANGVITDYSYHPRGWLTASKIRGADDSSESDDRITLIDYWPTGLVKQVAQPDGAFIRFTYDAAQRLTDVADNAGNTIHYTLDNAGNRAKEDTRDASGTLKRTLSRVYNQLGQLATQATAQGDPTDFGYDANGNTKTVTDALGHVTQNDYDPLNRLARTLQDVGGIAAETKFGYDALDNLTQVTDPKGLDTTYAYNGLGDLTKLTSPDTGVTTYTYDSAGNRATQTDARNVQTTYGYDALNRLTQVTYPTSSLNVTYTYDVSQATCGSGETYAVGRLTRMQDGSGSTDYCYDRFGDLVRKVQTTNGKMFVLRYAYTKAGQLSRLTYPDGAAVDYVRNAQGQTTEVGVTPAGGARQVLLGNATYYPFGPVANWTYGNGRPMHRVLDQDYRPLAVSDMRNDGLSTGFAFDPAGNLSALTAAGNTAPVVSLDYDALGRLTAFKDGPTGTVIDGYSYDATGNRLSAKVNTATQTYTYQTTSHRLDAVAGTARTYDASGNTTSIGGTALQLVYGASGRLGQVKRSGTVVMNYAYNGRGEQVWRVGTTDIYTLYDESGHWIGDYDNDAAPLQQAIWLDDLPVGVLAKNSLRYVQPDHLGTPRAVIDPVRDVAIWTWDLKGEAFGHTPPDQDPDKDGTAFVFDMRFPGQRYDVVTGFNQNYFRDYDASIGRYGQSDPIGLGGGAGTYAYANGNPIELVDPLGLQDSAPAVTRTETGGYSIKWRYYVNRTLEALGFPGTFVAGAGDFGKQYVDQWSATHLVGGAHNGWFGQDKYFHCMANCQAAQKGMGGSTAAQCISDGREWFDQNIKGDTAADSAADQLANLHGRSLGQMSPAANCSQICMGYRPGGNFPF